MLCPSFTRLSRLSPRLRVVLLTTLVLAPLGANATNFVRSDTDSNGVLEITDAVRTFGFLFLGGAVDLDCLDAADANDSGKVDISDGIFALAYLYLGGPPPPAPFPECGLDPSADDLACESFPLCPDEPAAPSIPLLDPLTSPTAETIVSVGGLADPGVEIVISGGADSASTLADGAGRFRVDVPLRPNRLHRLSAFARDLDGRTSAPRFVDVIQDSQPPFVRVDFPADGSETLDESVTVAGRVSDPLSGFDGLSVLVDGAPANVVVGIGTNGTFERAAIPLELGENTLTVIARDSVGNTSETETTIRRVALDPEAATIEVVSGNGQSAVVQSLLPEPLVVRVLRPDGSPFARKLVSFRVVRSDGQLRRINAKDDEPSRLLQVRTDAKGIASVRYRLGTDAGCGNHRVVAESVGAQGVARFCASAEPGPPVQINVGTGGSQVAEVGSPLIEPLRVWVSDGCNGVEGVPVSFRVARGTGTVNGESEVVVRSSRTGHASVDWILGPEAGEQLVEASHDENRAGPSVFAAIALERSGTDTSFVGFVRNNAEQPLGGALCQLLRDGQVLGETSSDLHGRFSIEGVSDAGPAELFVEGRTVTRVGAEAGEDVPEGSYPSLRFEVNIVPLAENQLPAPVLLPPLREVNERSYDGTANVTLEVDGIEGFRIHVAAGSMSLPDGSRPSKENPVALSLNPVHIDDIPMPMTDGASPPFAWTLQPHGARFDPPARVEFPNMSGLPPGAIANFLSFDHDTARFEIVATGQVSDDGATILSDPGVGIPRAGWGGVCPPYSVMGEVRRCARISAEKLEGGEVINGDYLCKDQRQSLRLTADFDINCGEGEPEWSVRPEAAGRIVGPTIGRTVIFEQADGYVSTKADDVEISATRGEDVRVTFRLTVFHIESFSGAVFVNDVAQFPSEAEPADADPRQMAKLLNEFISLAGFTVRQFAEGADPLAQPIVNGVIQQVKFIERPGDEKPLWVEVTAAAAPGDVFLTLEQGAQLLHQEHVTVLDAEITSMWSDQFEGIEVNKLPGSSGGKNHKYILMGPRDAGGGFVVTQIKARARVATLPAEIRDRFRILLAREGAGGIDDLQPIGDGEPVIQGDIWTVTLRHGHNLSGDPLVYRVVAGIDLDESGRIEAGEIANVFGRSSNFHARVVTRSAYEFHRAFFIAGGGVPFPTAGAHLRAFVVGVAPEGTRTEVDTITPNVLDHNVGVNWRPDGTAELNRYVYSVDSLLSSKIVASEEFEERLELVLDSRTAQVRRHFESNPNDPSESFTFPMENRLSNGRVDRGIDFGPTSDLHLGIGSATLFVTLTVEVTRVDEDLTVTSVRAVGNIVDTYDWNLGEGFGLDARAAQVQAGFGTLGVAGGVFKIEVPLDHFVPEFEYVLP